MPEHVRGAQWQCSRHRPSQRPAGRRRRWQLLWFGVRFRLTIAFNFTVFSSLLPELSSPTSPIMRVDLADVDLPTLLRNFLSRGLPVILTDVIRTWRTRSTGVQLAHNSTHSSTPVPDEHMQLLRKNYFPWRKSLNWMRLQILICFQHTEVRS